MSTPDHEPAAPQTPTPSGNDDDPVELSGPEQPAWGTTALVLFNLAVGLVMAWSGVPVVTSDAASLVQFGAVDPTRIWSGEPWRLLTACFVHVGAIHLGLNLWVLWQVGRVFERLAGPGRTLLIYLVSGVFGFALSIALMPGLTAGASGAIFGITGALLAVAVVARHGALGRFLATTLLPFVVGTFVIGAVFPMINNVAHFGGLVIGFVLGFGLCAGDPTIGTVGDDAAADGERVSSTRATQSLVAILLSLASFAAVFVYALHPVWSPRFHVVMGLRDLHTAQLTPPGTEQAAAARERLARARTLADTDPGTILLAARVAEFDNDAATSTALANDAFRRRFQKDAATTFEAFLVELALLEPGAGADAMPYADGYTTRTLCRAALAAAEAPDDADAKPDAPTAPSPSLARLDNGCAWLFVRASETAVRDPALAVTLARRAHAALPDDAAVTHTLAVSLADAGNAADGLALLEQLVVKGSGGLDRAFLDAERHRLGEQLRAQQAKAQAAP